MGEQNVSTEFSAEQRRAFTQRILTDLRAMEHMLEHGHFETGVRRIGAEQEIVLVDHHCQPAMTGMDILERLGDEHYTTELGRFNIEYNLDPILFGGTCLREMERQLAHYLKRVQEVARQCDTRIALTGILPTLQKTHMDIQFMTPRPRYFALNEAMNRIRGDQYELHLNGIDELLIKHDTVMLEACNTSFQVHFQVSPAEFAQRYNVAQAVTAPVLAAAVNSPLLFGKRLWRETRIGLFQQAIDTRSTGMHAQERRGRVSFGNRWVDSSVVEIFREDVSRFRLLFGVELEEDPFEALAAGRPPKLEALRFHNGTVYRWNRPCYGIHEGRPHLRIENRVFPAGPTVVDSVANAAFWFGLMSGVAEAYGDIAQVMDFDAVKENFVAAARAGLHAQLKWIDDRPVPVVDLICQRLLPLARDGLNESGIDSADIDKYLGIIRERVCRGRTGAAWQLQSLAAMKSTGTLGERMNSLTTSILANQETGKPVHQWPLATLDRGDTVRRNYQRIEQYMTTDVVTVNQDDAIDLVANMMDWEKIRHVPVEDNQHRLVGLISYRQLLRVLGQDDGDRKRSTPVGAIMQRQLVTVAPATSTVDAIRLMRQKHVACLPVVKDDRLVGIVTEHDFLLIAAELIERELNN